MKTHIAFLLAVVLIGAAVPVLSHHSFTAEYDGTKPVKVTGTVTKVEWTNPHIWFYVDVKDENGNVTSWAFSAAPPGVLQRRGIRTMLPGARLHLPMAGECLQLRPRTEFPTTRSNYHFGGCP